MARTRKAPKKDPHRHSVRDNCQTAWSDQRGCRVYWGRNNKTGKTCGKTSSYKIAKRKGIRTTWPNYRRCKPGTKGTRTGVKAGKTYYY